LAPVWQQWDSFYIFKDYSRNFVKLMYKIVVPSVYLFETGVSLIFRNKLNMD
jgi:hypothetical protein